MTDRPTSTARESLSEALGPDFGVRTVSVWREPRLLEDRDLVLAAVHRSTVRLTSGRYATLIYWPLPGAEHGQQCRLESGFRNRFSINKRYVEAVLIDEIQVTHEPKGTPE